MVKGKVRKPRNVDNSRMLFRVLWSYRVRIETAMDGLSVTELKRLNRLTTDAIAWLEAQD